MIAEVIGKTREWHITIDNAPTIEYQWGGRVLLGQADRATITERLGFNAGVRIHLGGHRVNRRTLEPISANSYVTLTPVEGINPPWVNELVDKVINGRIPWTSEI